MSHSGINPGYIKKKKEVQKADHYVDGILSGDRYILSEAITLVESDHAEKQALASTIMAQLNDRVGKTNTKELPLQAPPE
ncbi:MAG: hypothetical protein IPN29_21380 [Saprospiraceae bacterium]|nr:hypothetical protein [Saprospiraceae bacterium]